jgi:hypothetical protein
MESLRRWCAAHGNGVSLRVVKVAVKGGSYGSRGNLKGRGFCFATVIFGTGEMNATEP